MAIITTKTQPLTAEPKQTSSISTPDSGLQSASKLPLPLHPKCSQEHIIFNPGHNFLCPIFFLRPCTQLIHPKGVQPSQYSSKVKKRCSISELDLEYCKVGTELINRRINRCKTFISFIQKPLAVGEQIRYLNFRQETLLYANRNTRPRSRMVVLKDLLDYIIIWIGNLYNGDTTTIRLAI